MKTTKPPVTKSPAPNAKSGAKPENEPAVEVDRRGKPLPPRQRVGGIITPQ